VLRQTDAAAAAVVAADDDVQDAADWHTT